MNAKHIFSCALLCSLLALSGCLGSNAKSQSRHSSQAPSWYHNPQIAGQVVGLGSARSHIQGPTAQRELAISRALDEIARQQGVAVSNILVSSRQMSATQVSSRMNTESQQVVDSSQVTATIYGEWNNGTELFILMVAE